VPEYLSYAEAGMRLPTPKTADTIRRWANEGLRGVFLETVWIGGTPHVTIEGLTDFIARSSAARRKKKSA
jgi:hypothetical protein